jgi:hypothetical protein
MTSRERLTAIIHREPTDRLAWTTLVDWTTLSTVPAELQGRGGMDFYAYVGCDALLLDGWGSPYPWTSPRLQWGPDVKETSRTEGDYYYQEWHSPAGTVTKRLHGCRHDKYPVESAEDLRVYRAMWEDAQFVGEPDLAHAKKLDEFVGDAGLHVRYWWPSVVQDFLQFTTGVEHFYYLLSDCRGEMEELMQIIHRKQCESFKIMGQLPMEAVILPENTSTTLISPDLYRRYSLPQVRDFVDIMHSYGKVALIHMCGLIHALLPDIKATGLDGVHGLTPPPVGNTPWEEALDILGEDTITFGVLDPSVFCRGTAKQVTELLDAVYTERLRRSHFCMWASADGLRVPLENFMAIKAWMDKQS